ncbi:MAG: class I SAM-dependent methyltransferase [Thermodesulfobacteriota bacterium]
MRLPELRGISESDFDLPAVTAIQRRIIRSKPGLRLIYREYCRPGLESAARAPVGARMLEIGSGVSPLKDYIPGLITSDVVYLSWLDLVCSAYDLPFPDLSLDRIFLVFVWHHLGRVEKFLEEVRRCLKPGGEMVIVDPAVTAFSKWYYRYLHMDELDLESVQWSFAGDRRLSDSNIALAWIVFFRDRNRFERLYPELTVRAVEFNTCLSFLLSGGLRIRQLLPTRLLKIVFRLENLLIKKVTRQLAATMVLTIQKNRS